MTAPFKRATRSRSLKQNKLNSEHLIIEWLAQIPHKSIIGSHHIQIDVAQWIRQTYGTMFNPDTLMRKFRGIKNDKSWMFSDAGITLKEVSRGGKEKSWEVLNAS